VVSGTVVGAAVEGAVVSAGSLPQAAIDATIKNARKRTNALLIIVHPFRFFGFFFIWFVYYNTRWGLMQ
jgi:hypothetical protein